MKNKLLLLIIFAVPAFVVSAMIVGEARSDNTITPIASGVAMCGQTVASGVNLDMSACTGGLMMPVGTTSQRPAASQGIIRFNSDNLAADLNNGTTWSTLGILTPASYNNTPSHTIVTTAAAANGFQLSSTRDAEVTYSILETVTASIASGQSGYVVLEICPTNSAVAANWIEVNRISSAQTYTLAVAIQGVQGAGNTLWGRIPAGYYARLRSVNVTGTPTYSLVSGQEVLI